MNKITTEYGITTGVSEDGLIIYRSCDDGALTIDGRTAWRGKYLDFNVAFEEREDVSAAEWEAACLLMAEVRKAHRMHCDKLRNEANAHHDGIREREYETLRNVRGGSYDTNSY